MTDIIQREEYAELTAELISECCARHLSEDEQREVIRACMQRPDEVVKWAKILSKLTFEGEADVGLWYLEICRHALGRGRGVA